MEEKTAVKNLKEIKEVFDKYGIKYWLDMGTLLGAVRDGKIIEWDKDIDLGTTEDSWKKIVSTIPKFEERGFDVRFGEIYKNNLGFINRYVVFNKFGCMIGVGSYPVKGENAFMIIAESTNYFSGSLEILYRMLTFQKTHVNKRKVIKFLTHCMSLIPLKLKKPLSNMVWQVWKRSGAKFFSVIIPKHHFKRLGAIKFYEMMFNIPSNAEDYLKYRYGEDWRTPKKGWKWLQMDGSVRALTV